MTDKELKVKILAKIEELFNSRPIQMGYNCALGDIRKFINSLPEEHPYKTGDKVWYLNELYTLEDDDKHYILTSVRNNSVIHLDYGDEDFRLLPYEEPISEDLEEAANKYSYEYTTNDEGNGGDDWEDDIAIAFKAGALWQKTQSIVDTCYHLEMRLPKSLDYNGTIVERKDFITDFKKVISELNL